MHAHVPTRDQNLEVQGGGGESLELQIFSGRKSLSAKPRLTVCQQRCLDLARQSGRKISSRAAIAAGLGPSTCGLLANKGLLVDLGQEGGTQWYQLPDDHE